MIKKYALVFISFLTVNLCADELLKATKSWDGGSFAYPTGKPQVTAIRLKLDEGQSSPHHCHPVPTMGYVIKGEIEVTLKSGKKRTFKAGDSVVEVMQTVHQGKAINGPVEIVVFYAGEVGTPNTILDSHQDFEKYCK